MGSGGAKSVSALGFLTVVEHPQFGLFGGYLVLNMAGRPLEFHCTSPIKPNRAQEILYGPTLEGFLYGEQIGQTLVSQATSHPLVICTDRCSALATREFVSAPMVLVIPPEEDTQDNAARDESPKAEGSKAEGSKGRSEKSYRVDAAHRGAPRLVRFDLGRNHLAIAESADGDRQQISKSLATVAESFDLAEPFGRIREAIEEAQQAVR